MDTAGFIFHIPSMINLDAKGLVFFFFFLYDLKFSGKMKKIQQNILI